MNRGEKSELSGTKCRVGDGKGGKGLRVTVRGDSGCHGTVPAFPSGLRWKKLKCQALS